MDRWLPQLEAALRPEDAVFITADHGNDPTTPGTDHTREHVPLLAYGPGVKPARLGTRASFADLGQTIAEGLGVAPLAHGESFLAALRGGV
jgi:phosphopentomutase